MSRRLSGRGLPVEAAFASPAKQIRVPLNDDDEERSRRYKERNIMHEAVRNRLSFGGQQGTPQRRQAIDEDASEEINNAQQRLHATPKTPRNVGVGRRDRRQSMMTPMRRVVVGDFEEWMKMANDNKINATNSWNFALIDYFYDMTLLKEGDSVNFQKASCTLDGCVKIYTSRVDSVATETGKLLSGLADSDTKKKRRGDDGELGEDGEEGSDEDEEGGTTRKKRQRKQKTAESTLAKSFESIALKKFELEFTVDPLFKKASADFDEGGAKGLLLNHLSIDSKGRIVFDSSDDANDGTPQEQADEKEEKPEEEEQGEIDLRELRDKFFPDMDRLDELDICRALKNFDLGDAAGTLDIPFLKVSDEKVEDDDDEPDIGGGGIDFADDYELGAPGADGTMAFGEGGDLWANETIADAAQRFMTPARTNGAAPDDADDDPSGHNPMTDSLAITMNGNGGGHQQILSYFDEALRKNWAGPEHWRIRKLKDLTLKSKEAPTGPKKRKEKEVFEINFMDPDADIPESALLPESRTGINLPKDSKNPKNRNLLPDDKHFSSKNLIRLFLKPKAMIGSRRAVGSGLRNSNEKPPDKMDEDFWAAEALRRNRKESTSPRPAHEGQYDADFFNEGEMGPLAGFDDDDDDHFVDAPEEFPAEALPASTQASEMPGSSQWMPTQTQDFGSQLVTAGRRVRPEYVQYARVAKKVDVRRLKENLWRDLEFEKKEEDVEVEDVKPKQFTEVVNNLQQVYPKQAMNDISTSYCFICVLHLANEKGLIIKGNENLDNLEIVKDPTADGGDEY